MSDVDVKSTIVKTTTEVARFSAVIVEEFEGEDLTTCVSVKAESIEREREPANSFSIDLSDVADASDLFRDEAEALFAVLGRALQWEPES